MNVAIECTPEWYIRTLNRLHLPIPMLLVCKTKSARKIDKITVRELMKILLKEPSAAGKYPLLDFVALKVLERAKIPTIIFDATNPENIKKVVEGVNNRDEKMILKVGSIIEFDARYKT
mgnify:CR=1 FL=1